MTKAVQEVVKERVAEAKNELVASFDSDYDRVLKGMIRAYLDMLEIEPAIELDLIEEAE